MRAHEIETNSGNQFRAESPKNDSRIEVDGEGVKKFKLGAQNSVGSNLPRIIT